jgi:hypothetical protein
MTAISYTNFKTIRVHTKSTDSILYKTLKNYLSCDKQLNIQYLNYTDTVIPKNKHKYLQECTTKDISR